MSNKSRGRSRDSRSSNRNIDLDEVHTRGVRPRNTGYPVEGEEAETETSVSRDSVSPDTDIETRLPKNKQTKQEFDPVLINT